MGFKKFFKRSGKYVVKKVSKSAVGKAVKWAFWGIVCFYGPMAVIGTIGVNGLLISAAAAHSGLAEYSAGKIIDRNITDD